MIGRFRRERRGVIAVLGAAFIGIITVSGVGSVEYLLLEQARKNAQHALDEATLTAARMGSVDCNDDGDGLQGSADADHQATGNCSESNVAADRNRIGGRIFDDMLTNRRVSTIATEFRNAEDNIIEGTATVSYRTIFLQALGLMDVEILVTAAAAPGTAEDELAPACFVAVVGGVTMDTGTTLDAPECGVTAALGLVDNGNADTKLSCIDGACPVSNPYIGPINNWMSTVAGGYPCDTSLVPGWGYSIIHGPARFCDHVTVDAGQILHLLGGDFVFTEGLTVRAGGRLDSTGNGGSMIYIRSDKKLIVEAGAIFTIMPYTTGRFPGIALAQETLPGQDATVSIAVESPGHVHMSGIVTMDDADITLAGPGSVTVRLEGLAIWAKSIKLENNITLPGAPTTLGEPLPAVVKNGAPTRPRLIR